MKQAIIDGLSKAFTGVIATAVTRLFVWVGTPLLVFVVASGQNMVAVVVDSSVARSEVVRKLVKSDSIQDAKITANTQSVKAIGNKIDAFITASMNKDPELRDQLLKMSEQDQDAQRKAAENQKILEDLSRGPR